MAVQEPTREPTPVRTVSQTPILKIGDVMGRLGEIIARNGEPPWVEPLVMTDDVHAWVICHPPGQPNDTHYHLHDEWWVVLRGEIEWWIEGEDEPIRAKAGDFVFGPKERWHHIEPVGNEPTIRLGIKEPSEFHRYDRPGCRSKPWRLKPGETPATAAPQD